MHLRACVLNLIIFYIKLRFLFPVKESCGFLRRRKLGNLGNSIVSFACSFRNCTMHCVWLIVWKGKDFEGILCLLLLAWESTLFPGHFVMHQPLTRQETRFALVVGCSPRGFWCVPRLVSCLRHCAPFLVPSGVQLASGTELNGLHQFSISSPAPCQAVAAVMMPLLERRGLRGKVACGAWGQERSSHPAEDLCRLPGGVAVALAALPVG